MKGTITQSEEQIAQLVTDNQIKWYRCQLNTWSKKTCGTFHGDALQMLTLFLWRNFSYKELMQSQ